jgi:multimeric flavodoxin WrbA
MRVVVLNGSPKGEQSVTMQYIRFLQQELPQHEFLRLDVAHYIERLEHREAALDEVCEQVRAADAVLWAFPLYFFLVAAQYKRFVELLWERGLTAAFEGKYAAALSTSIHAFDHTAHQYVNAVCDDLQMRFFGGYSADMYDLLHRAEQKRLATFAAGFLDAARRQLPTIRNHAPLARASFRYVPACAEPPVPIPGKRVVLLHDGERGQGNIVPMVDALRRRLEGTVEVVDLRAVRIRGGCLGCIRCAYEYQCAYADKDDYMAFYNDRLRTADVIVLAGTVVDRYLSSRWKTFFDRSFFNNHTPTLIGKQVALMVSGPLSQLPHLRQLVQAWVEFQQANLAGVVTDECGDSTEIDRAVGALAHRLADAAAAGYVAPATFLGVGLGKVFRDDVYSRLRFPFQADHRFYKAHGLYDFPQKDYRARLTAALMGLLVRVPALRDRIYRKEMKPGMIRPFQRLFAPPPRGAAAHQPRPR